MSEKDLRCYHHPGREAVAQCDRCGDMLCAECAKYAFGKQVCPVCLELDTPPSDPSIFSKPHLLDDGYGIDPSEAAADRVLGEYEGPATDAEHVQNSVWEEPIFSEELAGPVPESELTYSRWLVEQRGATSVGRSWIITLGIALLAGPWAVLGAFWGSGQTGFSVLAIVVFAPVVEETTKIALALYVVEKYPYLFRGALQIALCAVAGGLAFATVENLLYQHVYLDDPSPGLLAWRWTICTAMHTGCAFVSGLGLIRILRDTWKRRKPPRLSIAFPYFVISMVIHGLYNLFAILLSATGYRF